MILCFDTETTSEKPHSCRVVQVAAIGVTNDPATGALELQTIMDEITDPGLESSDAATAIHGIGPEHWAGKRRDSEAIAELYAWMSANYLSADGTSQFTVAGHNVRWFDLPILWRIAEQEPLFGLPVIDTMICAQRIYPLAPSHRLTTNPKEPDKVGLIEWLQLGQVEGAHTAAGDALMVHRLVEHFCGGLQKTPLELATWCNEARILKYCPFGKHKGKPWGKGPGCVPIGYARFIADNFDPSPDLEVTIRHNYGFRFKKVTRQ
jgi:DNA polymerase III epsilon subunit-like protein